MAGGQDNQGFTLIEMVVAVIIIGIISSITPVVMSKSVQNYEMNQFINQYLADAIFAKNFAQYMKKSVIITINAEARMYTMYDNFTKPLIVRTIPKSICFPQRNFVVRYTGTGAISQGHTLYLSLIHI